MCKSKAEGGARCYTHTSPHYEMIREALHSSHAQVSLHSLLTSDEVARMERAADAHAESPEGAKEIRRDLKMLNIIMSDRIVHDDSSVLQMIAILESSLEKSLRAFEVASEVASIVARQNYQGHRSKDAYRDDALFREHNARMCQIASDLRAAVSAAGDDDGAHEAAIKEAKRKRREEIRRYEASLINLSDYMVDQERRSLALA